jgi:predicted ATPase
VDDIANWNAASVDGLLSAVANLIGGSKSFWRELQVGGEPDLACGFQCFKTLEAEAYSKAGRALAAVQAIEEALEWSKKTDEKWALAQVLRLKAHLLRGAGKAGDNDIVRLLRTSLNIAYSQSARSFELRAACDLARHLESQGKRNKAVSLLRHSHEKFTEGYETEDLREAAGLIQILECDDSGPVSAARIVPLND